MNLNNFVVLPSKPKSMKLNVRNLRELRMETVQLDQHAKEMERRLEELRQHMNQEKEEREKMGASHWRSAQPGVQSVKENAPHRLSPDKMKIRVLKDEPVPAVQEQLIAERAAKVHGTNRKLNLKGKVCGQCEVQLAGLMCAECREDYCVGCFVRFHQKGALKHHRMVPVQVLFVNDGVDVEDEEAGEEEDSSLLRGGFDEEESARSFQEALKEWRERGQRPVSVMETQTEKGSQPLIYVEFKEDTLSYMEKLLMKKHRRGQIEEFQHRSVVQRQPEPPTPPPTETDELSRKLTAERMELHKYFTSLFTIAPAEDAGKADSPAESCLSIIELDEKMAGDATLYRSFGVKQGNESKMFAAVGNEDLSEGGDFGYSVLPSTPSFSEMTKESFSECNSGTKINSSPEMWPSFQEATQSSSSLPRSESFSPLQTRLQKSQHLSTTSEPFLLTSQTGGQKVELSDSPKPSPRMRSSSAQQDKPSELLPTSSPSLPKTKLNQTLLGFEDHISTIRPSPGRVPSVRSSQSHSPAFLISKQSPKPPDSPSPRSRSASSPVNPIQSIPAHSTPVSKPKLAQLSPEFAITSPSATVPSLKPSPRESSQSALVSDRSTSTMPTYDSIRSSTPRAESSHTDGHRSPPASKWLKASQRSPKTTVLSLQLSMSDSEEEMTGEDACLVPSEEDSSDEELRRITDAEEQKNGFPSLCPTTTPLADPHFTFTNLTKSDRDTIEPDLFTGSSQAIHSVAQRQDIQSGQYQDLEGILTLGLDPGVLQPSPAPAQTSREEQNHTGSLLAVMQESWRSSSSLQLVTALMNAQPINSTPRPFTPCRGRMSSQRLCFSGTISRCSPISSRPLSAGTHSPDPSNRLLSRAALEIMEVQTVEQLDLQDSDEDEEDFLALACLEEEFRNMSTTQLDEGEDGHIPVD
ncbi:zinc finger B-box domain-containing protein 1-like [Sinocyclocheilus grahami]|uniref:zinc finger B-box domain-containing protein 1-like n=1 Tax=Sinocyclocheilus grahami TaxID=75366 RepID=UPI0007AD2276|nr:PREDICTED: zinc finger B-box domain-containing protein 1-like [Sinocyclocheilus grahami]